jgi:hypothetical protein
MGIEGQILFSIGCQKDKSVAFVIDSSLFHFYFSYTGWRQNVPGISAFLRNMKKYSHLDYISFKTAVCEAMHFWQ